ncbi:AAA family ATPase [Trinickia caryophylli]|uniref:trifunctional serine/threonine-protein kinase/ATP-binding protein/sensor histidine kinase n=1 Tax=Trinickia caryophylli TaxID=28094 RepID=UPI000A15D642|nr:AAA family ATPase [Trinickia caryophylli]PMS11972.1 PAS domain S-box protein [Trinickia caryophylli]TRX13949.1 AAA family ATPase [Trinickia caryophylli]
MTVAWDDGEYAYCHTRLTRGAGAPAAVLAVVPARERAPGASAERLSHEYGLRDELDGEWALRPLALLHEEGRPVLIIEDPGAQPLEHMLDRPMDVLRFCRLASAMADALGRVHERGLVHKDVKPSHIVVDETSASVRFTGFGIATCLPRQRQLPEPPELIAGSLPYMAPEQTGRMNRSIDARSDLYSLGVTFYRMLTGVLPFSASEPMAWIHCHIAGRPVPPSVLVPGVPVQVSRIVMRLLAKAAEERYQTAAGLAHDLRRCEAEWRSSGRVDAFALGDGDVCNRLLIPEKLYGREREIAALLAVLGRVAGSGEPELVLVAGPAGIGKSSVVHELHKELLPLNGLFASGKFDQYKRDIPYSTLAEALRSLVRRLLGKAEVELANWRRAIEEALGPNGRLMIDLVPELEVIVGAQPEVPTLAPQLAQTRFQLVLRRFMGVFARPEHPLVLFLDDLQWLDVATLELLDDLLARPDLRYLMLVGAYRDNDVGPQHPLARRIEAMRRAGARINEIEIGPLPGDQVAQLTADALRTTPERVEPLAQTVRAKTDGNPFFIIQFLRELSDKALLGVDRSTGGWRWHIERIRAARHTDNVVELMAARLASLAPETREALQTLACLGDGATAAMLSAVHGTSEQVLDAHLRDAVRLELVECAAGFYRFGHDRIQEAAYSLIACEARPRAHLAIGRLLLSNTPEARREECVFDLVSQLNRAVALITQQPEREALAELNLMAGKRAKASTAYAAALGYLTIGAALLGGDAWQRQHRLSYALELERAECELLTGELEAASARLVALSARAIGTVEQAAVACLRMDVCTAQGRSDIAIEVALDYLRGVGIHWPANPTDDEVRAEYQEIGRSLGGRSIEALVASPVMTNPEALSTVEVLVKAQTPAIFTDINLASISICKAVNLSLAHGNCDASCFAYVMLARIAGPRFGDFEAGFRFGQLGYDLVEQRGLGRFAASTYLVFVIVVARWMKHVRESGPLLSRAFDTANRAGDLLYASYACNNLNSQLLFAGTPLHEAQDEIERGLAFAQAARFGLVVDIISTQRAFVRSLRGGSPAFGRLDDELVGEPRLEQRLSESRSLAIAECWYWIRKLQARYLAGRYADAVDAACRAQALLWTSTLFLEEAEFHFYAALALAAYSDTVAPARRRELVESIAVHHRQLATWARYCPDNFEGRAALVGAEIARIEGRAFEAQSLYEQAIRSSEDNGFVHNEALASELAAAFFAARDVKIASQAYLRHAHQCYLKWGAGAKASLLEATHACLRTGEGAPASARPSVNTVEQLDLATVIKLSQAVAGEMDLHKLIDVLMRTAVEQAGANRGLLVLSQGPAQRIQARATSIGAGVAIRLVDEPVGPAMLSETILRYVLRTRERVVVGDAARDSSFSSDPYIENHSVRSVLCVPLIVRARLIGALYLENDLAADVFSPAAIAVLEVLASQAAATLENARLYRGVVESEAKIRRLVDSNIVGIFIYSEEGRILEANEALLRMLGYDRRDLAAGRIWWRDLTPPEWLERDVRIWEPMLRDTGKVPPFEKEYFRKDGSRVPILIGVANFDEAGSEGVAFVLDLTEQKQAEAEARENELRYREVQTALAHVNRVTTMGQLAAAIGHEVKQPIATAVTHAEAGLRFLSAQPPKLAEASQAFSRIIDGAMRAGEVVDRIRRLVRNAPPSKEPVLLNEAIEEVIAMTRTQAQRGGVSVSVRLAADLPRVRGDRVQLQQAVLNLIVNAIEAMGSMEDGQRALVVSTKKDASGAAVVTVSDSGPGIEAAERDRLFEPFFTTKATGMGMGLAICQTIVDAHAGWLRAAANTPRGAIFEFGVPGEAGAGH